MLVLQPGKFHQTVIFLICKMKQRIVHFSEAGGCSCCPLHLPWPPAAAGVGVGWRAEAGRCPGPSALGVIFTWPSCLMKPGIQPCQTAVLALLRRTKGTGWGDAGDPPVSGIKVIPEPKRSEGAASPPCRFFTGSRTVSSAVLPHRQAALLGTLAELLGQ